MNIEQMNGEVIRHCEEERRPHVALALAVAQAVCVSNSNLINKTQFASFLAAMMLFICSLFDILLLFQLEQTVNKFMLIKNDQVINFFSHTNIFNRNIELIGYRKYHTTFCSSI